VPVTGQNFLAPFTQPQVLALQVKSATTEPQSAGPLQQVGPPFDVYVHENETHERFWQLLPAAQLEAIAQQPLPARPVCVQLLPVMPSHRSSEHPLLVAHSPSLAQPPAQAVSLTTQAWLTQLTASQRPRPADEQSLSPLHDDSSCARWPMLVGA
jgi:hypothetical protein